MRTEADYPRTLIVGVHFSERSGPGTFLGRLFSAWPTDRLATVCGDLQAPDWRQCHRHYRTGELRFPLRAVSHWLVPGGRLGPMSPSAPVAPASTAAPPTVSLGHRLARYPWRAFLRLLAGGDIIYRNDPTLQLLAWVRDFEPEVIYGHCSNLNRVLFLRRMQQALGLPLVLHFMDDFPESCYRAGLVSRFVRPQYLAMFAELVRSADVAIAICQAMAEEYERRYQRRIVSLPMPVELDAYQGTARNHRAAKRPFRIQFGGRVGWALRESLLDIAQAVSILRQEGVDVVFDILTFEPENVPAVCRASNGVTVQAAVPTAELPRRQLEADTLVICLDFDPKSIRDARYSMPSKMAGCLASGTPVLVYGPAGSPVVEYARREGWGRVVDRRDSEALRAAIRELMDSAALREQLGRTAQRLAAERHDSKMVSERFRAMLQNPLRKTPAPSAD